MPQQKNPNDGYVLVVDKNGQPLMPCLASRVRQLRQQNRTRVYCKNPFTIQIVDRTVEESVLQETELKLDPGSKTTGMALCVKGDVRGWFAVQAIHIQHRSVQIRDALTSRRQIRRSRRQRKTRYRAPRFNNRARKPRIAQGYSVWLAPSVVSRIENIVNLCSKFSKCFPTQKIAGELNRFDTQRMVNSEITGIEYQQGTLQGFEVREYLLQKYSYTCVYCQKCAFHQGKATCVDNRMRAYATTRVVSTRHSIIRLEIDHVVPRSKGGSDRVSNLVLACHDCNQHKGNLSVEDFLKNKPAVLKRVQEGLKKSLNLQDAAQMNTMRKELYHVLENRLLLPVETFTASQTKYNRVQQKYHKDHWVDASCVGETGNQMDISHISHTTVWKAVGRGNRQMCLMDKYGFPRTSAKTVKRYTTPTGVSFQTGDSVVLKQPSGKYKGMHRGTVSIRATGQCDITTTTNRITSSWKNFTKVSLFNGYMVTQRSLQ